MKEFIIWPSANSTAAARLLCALVVVLALASCADNAPSLARAHRSSDPLLSILGPASGIETRDSRFVFRQSSFRRTAKDELTDIQASAIANAFAKNFLMWPELYASRGVPRPSMVDRHLNSCDETRYAASRFEPLASDLPASTRRRFGPYWLVPMCDKSSRAVAIFAVSALATEVTISRDNALSVPPYADGGEIIHWTGIPVSANGWGPISPETSAERVAALTGGQLAVTPELLAPDPRVARPTHASWRIVLGSEHTVVAKDGGRLVASEFEVTEVDQGNRPTLQSIRAVAPRAAQEIAIDVGGEPPRAFRSIKVRERAEYARLTRVLAR